MFRFLYVVLFFLGGFCSFGGEVTLNTDFANLKINGSGRIVTFLDTKGKRKCLVRGMESRLASIRMWGEKDASFVKSFSAKTKGRGVWVANLSFGNGVKALVEIKNRGDYLTFEVKSLSSKEVEYFQWGPLYVSLSDVVGGAVGVARDDKFAVCLRSLDLNTAGGLFGEEEVTGGIRDLKGAVRLSKKESASKGVRLSAYAKDRSRADVIEKVCGLYYNAPAFPVKGVTPVGSKVALFGISSEKVLDVLEEIVKREGVPYPKYNGVWTKRPQGLWVAPRLICPFSVDTVDDYIAIAKVGSFKMLHQKVPYESKGTFEPKKDLFPNGYESASECAEKIKAAGLIPSFHSLSAFIDFNDPLVTPVPNKHLALASMAKLGKKISSSDKTILLVSASIEGYTSGLPETGEAINSPKGKKVKARKAPPILIRVEDEIILYKRAVSKGEGQVELSGCTRGYCGTKAKAHAKDNPVGRCSVHKRKAFFPDIYLLPTVAKNLAQIYVKGGMQNTSFDGLESTDASGHGAYAQALFVDTVWKEVLKVHPEGTFLSSSSRLGSYYWYLVSHETWGEPHAAGFRHEESYYDGRIAGRIKKILIPNYVPFRLGQYQFGKLSRVTDIEWLLTKCVGWDGGWFDLYLSLDDYKASGDFGKKIMDTITMWIEARKAGVFDPKLLPDMRKFKTVYRVSKKDDGGFRVVKLSEEESKEVVKPIVVKKKKGKNNRELYH